MTIALFSTADIRAIESGHAQKHPKVSLMQRAGAATAKLAQSMLRKKRGAAILVLAGPGNNGGDAWVAAATLKKAGQRVTLVAPGDQKSADAAAKAAQVNYVRGKGAALGEIPEDQSFDLIIDGLFGIGLARAPGGAFARAITGANALRARDGTPILAVDIPSGLAGDTGVALGDTITADHTITFLGAKPGLFTGAGRDHAGEVHLEMLGVVMPASRGALLTAGSVRGLIPSRRHHSHKGSYGNVAIIGGAEGMVGAAMLAARAALMMGPGKVYAGIAAKDVPAYDPLNPELMLHKADELVGNETITALAVGMGLGMDKAAPRLLSAVLSRKLPTVLDADALNLIAGTPGFAASLGVTTQNTSTGAPSKVKMSGTPRQSSTFILTPHPGEAARLLNVPATQIESDRVTSALALADRFNAIVILKGAGTVIATPDERYFINTSGNPGMASGGMGDALSGMIAAFLAQGVEALAASQLAVYLHGAAADACMAHGMAPHGLTASEVIFEARMLLNAGLEHHDH